MKAIISIATIIIFGISSCSSPENKASKNEEKSSQQTKQTVGSSLYNLVETYSNMGYHRTGTSVDSVTNKWFSDELKHRGGKVSQQAFKFEKFENSVTVTIDGDVIPSLPLFYEGTGSVESNSPFVSSLNVMSLDRTTNALNNAIQQAIDGKKEIAVIATQNKFGELATPNRFPKLGSGLPVILVPGKYADKLKEAEIKVKYDAKIVSGESNNIIAVFGDTSKVKPIILATPLSGWFNCAAERGTGIAVAIKLASELSKDYPVVVIGAPGHEILHHIGLEHFLNNNKIETSLIIHLGANVAIGVKDEETGRMKLAPGVNDPRSIPETARTVFVRMDTTRFKSLIPVLNNINLPAVVNPPHWNGEAALWAKSSPAPLMSFTGISPIFHTPSDIPENATNAELLEDVYNAIYKSITIYMNQNEN